MSEKRQVTIQVYGKEYSIVSSADPADTERYAEYIDNIMRDIADATSATDPNRVAILALLQITHELFALKKRNKLDDEEFDTRLEKLLNEINISMSKSGIQTEIKQ